MSIPSTLPSTLPSALPIPDGYRMLKDKEVLQEGTLFYSESQRKFIPIYAGPVALTPSHYRYRIGSVYHRDSGHPGINLVSILPVFDVTLIGEKSEILEKASILPVFDVAFDGEKSEILEKASIKVLRECMELQLRKSNDYQNPNSRIRQADYYPNGIKTILDIMHAKMLRMYSVLEAMEHDSSYTPNFESIEDSCKDLVNYSSFCCAYTRGGIDGQDPTRDFLNRKIPA